MSTAVAGLFRPATGTCYLDTATYGLPPQPTVDAMSEALTRWQAGTARWIEDWDVAADRARDEFAGLVGVGSRDVALLPAASVGAGVVAASLTADDHVVVPDDEFASLLFPLLVAAERTGTTVDTVPFDDLVGRIADGTTLIATSLVQMQTGRVAELEAIVERAHHVGARVLLDATHGLPFVDTEGVLDRVDHVVCAAYKHLLCPRGVAFMVVRGDHHDRLAAWNANWRSTPDPYGRFFGGPLDLAPGGAAFDVSVAWLPWVGASVSLGLLRDWSEQGLLEMPRRRAAALAARLGVPWYGSSIVCVPVDDLDAAKLALAAAGVRAGFRAGSIRLSTHVYTTDADVDRAVEVLGGFVSAPVPTG
jgi:selenocysteine lyase/cysteine desulfurase